MENKLKFLLPFFLLGLSLLFLPGLLGASQDAAALSPAVNISLDFQDANLKDILKALSIQSGLNFIASEAVQERKITLYLDKVPLKEAMDKIINANNLTYELDKAANIFIVKDWGKPQMETVTQVFYLKYATVSSSSLKGEMSRQIAATALAGAAAGITTGSGKWAIEEDVGITRAIKKLLTEYGSVIEDYRTNSLIVIDTPSRMPVIAQAIAALDIPIPQVLIEVEMLDVSKNAVDKIGFKFGQTPFTAILTGASIGTMWPFGSTSLPFASERKFTPGSLAINPSGNTYTAMLDFLRTQTDTRYLARPKILTLNNETAEITISTDETVGVIQQVVTGAATTATTTPERVETGVALRVTPQVNLEAKEVTMFIVPTVKDTATSTFLVGNTGSTYYKDPETRSTKSTVRVKDGETVVIGGLLRREKTEIISKLPLLGDLPLVGNFFRHKDKSKDKERELIVFITPHIIKDTSLELAKAEAKKATIPEREQSPLGLPNARKQEK